MINGYVCSLLIYSNNIFHIENRLKALVFSILNEVSISYMYLTHYNLCNHSGDKFYIQKLSQMIQENMLLKQFRQF